MQCNAFYKKFEKMMGQVMLLLTDSSERANPEFRMVCSIPMDTSEG
jgi:hypothetical protein